MGNQQLSGGRVERDSFGEIEVPADRHWGAQTARSIRFFAIGDERMPLAVVHALAQVKAAAAEANAALGLLGTEERDLIVRAADEVVRRYLQDHGEHPRNLVIDLWASASLRTGGDDLAQALAYLGVRPTWDKASSRVTGIEVIPPIAQSLGRSHSRRVNAQVGIQIRSHSHVGFVHLQHLPTAVAATHLSDARIAVVKHGQLAAGVEVAIMLMREPRVGVL
mgnify:CR=1 FL=1